MKEDNKNAYSEVIEILKLIDDEKRLEALPMEMLEVLKLKANPEYKPQISKEIPLEEQNLQPETFSILSWIAMKYWNEDIEDGAILEQEQENENQNVEVIKENLAEKVSDDITKNTYEETTKIQSKSSNSTLPISYKDLKWYQKIKVKIIELFHRIFRRNGTEKDIDDKEEGSTL